MSASPGILPGMNRRALLALWSTPGVGWRVIHAANVLSPGLGDLLTAEWDAWLPLLNLPREAAMNLRQWPTLGAVAEMVERRSAQADATIVFSDEAGYPRQLAGVELCPPLLFRRGAAEAVADGIPIAVVGTRKASAQLLEWTVDFCAQLAEMGAVVISGAADGCDSAAHRGAVLARRPTVAFLASGLGEIDPAQRKVGADILNGGGALFSEFPPWVRARDASFPRRNRLVAGAATRVLVIRAAAKSGSLHTANDALRLGRPLFCVPSDPMFDDGWGSNDLLRQKLASICLAPEDVLPEKAQTSLIARGGQVRLPADLSAEAMRAFQVVDSTPRAFDEILARSAFESGILLGALCELELIGAVIQQPGKRYVRAKGIC